MYKINTPILFISLIQKKIQAYNQEIKNRLRVYLERFGKTHLTNKLTCIYSIINIKNIRSILTARLAVIYFRNGV